MWIANTVFIVIGLLCGYISAAVYKHYAIATPSEPTKVCRDGKLYEVTHEGNITIFDRQAFMICEETK